LGLFPFQARSLLYMLARGRQAFKNQVSYFHTFFKPC